MNQQSQAEEQARLVSSDLIKDGLAQINALPKNRTIILTYDSNQSCMCGPGGDKLNIRRTVPYDSPLKDGDLIGDQDLEKDDTIVD